MSTIKDFVEYADTLMSSGKELFPLQSTAYVQFVKLMHGDGTNLIVNSNERASGSTTAAAIIFNLASVMYPKSKVVLTSRRWGSAVYMSGEVKYMNCFPGNSEKDKHLSNADIAIYDGVPMHQMSELIYPMHSKRVMFTSNLPDKETFCDVVTHVNPAQREGILNILKDANFPDWMQEKTKVIYA